MNLTRDNFWLFLCIHALISIRQVPIERDNNIAVNVRSWGATSAKKEPFMAMLSPSRGTCLITDLDKICVPPLKATLLRFTNFQSGSNRLGEKNASKLSTASKNRFLVFWKYNFSILILIFLVMSD